MTKLEQIEKNIEELNPKEFAALAEWFEALQQDRWNRQIANDAEHGRLDRFADQALSDFRAGKTKPL